jgi:fatty-acyl-CoA synthase
MRLADYLDKGASVHPSGAPLFTMADLTADSAGGTVRRSTSTSYAQVRRLTWSVGRALARSGIRPGDKVAILSGNDPVAFSCLLGISRAGAVWCPVNPRNEAAENRELLAQFECRCLIFAAAFAPLVAKIVPDLPELTALVCLDEAAAAAVPGAIGFGTWLDGVGDEPWEAAAVDEVVAIAGTGGTTGRPKGVMLTERNIETMSAFTLMGYPFEGRPVYLALAPLTHAAGVLCFPVMALGGEIVIMPSPDLGEFLRLIETHRVTHAFLPPTLIYLLLDHPDVGQRDLSSLQCLWYGAAPMSPDRLAQAIGVFGPVMGQVFGQTEAPMMISTMAPGDHLHPDGTLATERFTSAGRPTPLTTVAIMDDHGNILPPHERGEIVVRGPLVMAGYYKNPAATAEASRYGWHHTGDIGYLDDENYLFIVDRLKDMIITGGFNVYSAEVEQALLAHPAVLDCGVIGLPDDKWGERVTAVLQLHPGRTVTPDEVRAFVKARIGSVKAPKQVEIWPDLPRSRVGKVLKTELKSRLLARGHRTQ